MKRRDRKNEHGVATIEMIGIIPIAALIAGAIIQLYMVGYAAVSAESASRLAAREASKGALQSQAEAAGTSDVNPLFSPVVQVRDYNQSDSGQEPSVSNTVGLQNPVSAKATLTVPFLGIGVKGLDLHITRYTVMPKTDD